MTPRRYRAWTKATDREVGGPQHSENWTVARRDWFDVYDDRLECGDWVIRADSVQNAVLYRSRQVGIPVSILAVESQGRTFQFGFNPWVRVERHLPFAFRTESARLGYSRFSLAIRIAVLAVILYLLLRG